MNKEVISLRGKILRDIIAEVNSHNNKKPKKEKIDIMEIPWKGSKDFDLEVIDFGNFKGEWLVPKNSTSNKVIMQLHGGGYVGKLKNSYRSLAEMYSNISGGAQVLTIDYRVAPKNIFPAALDDAILAYEWLLNEKNFSSNQVILGGDSAGGGLAIALTMYLRDNNLKLPLGIVAMSPWTDLTASGASYEDNFTIDPVFGNKKDTQIFDSDYIGDNDPKNPYISPVFGTFNSFPPILIQVGTHEMLLSDSLTVAEKLKEEKCKVKCSVYEGMFHVFQLAKNLLPESKDAWIEVSEFIKVISKLN